MHPFKKVGLYTVGTIAALATLGHIVGPQGEPVPAASADSVVTAPAPAPAVQPVVIPPAPPVQVPPTDENVVVASITDGDTLKLTDGRKVRLLVVDACEMSTKGGKEAKEYVESFVKANDRVVLVRDGATDTDRYGRLLRKVVLTKDADGDGSSTDLDLAQKIVGHPAIGIYDGKQDATADYVSSVTRLDFGKRDCAGTPEVPVSTGGSGGNSYDVDLGDGNMRDGALTGGFCARKWYC